MSSAAPNRDYTFAISYLDELVTACEQAFAGPKMATFGEDEDVSTPPTGITFGMIRRARGAVDAMQREPVVDSDNIDGYDEGLPE